MRSLQSEKMQSLKLNRPPNFPLLAKLLTTRIKEPEQYAKFRTAIDAPGPNWHGGPSEEDLERQAVDLANAITAKNAWVLEAEVAFSGVRLGSFGGIEVLTSIPKRALQILKTQR